ncbi:hypothetical protein [Vreelandella venusta]|uniref:hypothetical protein n=1 Tax=Vreelandella venusta TaxID=44935 RepID=UPI003AA8838D
MYSEFCLVLDKKELLESFYRCPDYGSLLETQTQSYKIGSIYAFFRSYELKVEMKDGCAKLLLGDAIYKGKLYQDSQQLVEDKVDIDEFLKNARGCYLLVDIDLKKNEVGFYNDPLSLYPVYWFENEQYSVVSNLPIWMESVLSSIGVELARDGLLAGYDLAVGTGAFGVTGWSDFHLIPFGSSLTLTQSTLRVVEFRSLDRFFKSNLSFEELLENSATEIRENIQAIAGSRYKNKVSDITGGMDSRLVLAGIFDQGLEEEFLYHTNGGHPVPDANCALNIMEVFDLTRIRTVCEYSQPVASQPINTFKSFIYQSQGSRFIYGRPFETNAVQENLIKVGGGLAGGFKSTYSLRLKNNVDKSVSLEDAVSAMFLPATDCLSDDLVRHVREELTNLFANLNKKYNISYVAAMDFFYVLSRSRYLIGVGEFPNSVIRPKVHALYGESLISAAFKLTDQERRSGKLHYELMKKLSPELWKLPFADQAWSTSLTGREDNYEFIEQVPITVKTPKLYGSVKNEVVEIRSIPESKNISKEEVLLLDKKWRKKQKDLGRNWMWQNFDNIHSLAIKYFESDEALDDGIFKKGGVNSVLGRSHDEFKRASDVRSVVNILLLALFKSKQEKNSRIAP